MNYCCWVLIMYCSICKSHWKDWGSEVPCVLYWTTILLCYREVSCVPHILFILPCHPRAQYVIYQTTIYLYCHEVLYIISSFHSAYVPWVTICIIPYYHLGVPIWSATGITFSFHTDLFFKGTMCTILYYHLHILL